jgi:hypothetical protein
MSTKKNKVKRPAKKKPAKKAATSKKTIEEVLADRENKRNEVKRRNALLKKLRAMRSRTGKFSMGFSR